VLLLVPFIAVPNPAALAPADGEDAGGGIGTGPTPGTAMFLSGGGAIVKAVGAGLDVAADGAVSGWVGAGVRTMSTPAGWAFAAAAAGDWGGAAPAVTTGLDVGARVGGFTAAAACDGGGGGGGGGDVLP
jgi:hypothetical protein